MDVHKKQRPFITEETLPVVDDALAFATRASQKPIARSTDIPSASDKRTRAAVCGFSVTVSSGPNTSWTPALQQFGFPIPLTGTES